MGQLWQTLGIRPGVTALIGSGGKTTLLYALARELESRGRVIVTTTTHLWPPRHLPVVAEAGLDAATVCVARWGQSGKLSPPEQPIARMMELADYVLVEADGAAGRPLKAHEAHEPVIPREVRQVITLVGAGGLCRPVKEAAHRPERFAALAGCTPQELATPERVARVLLAEGRASQVLINQADIAPEGARALARLLPGTSWIAALERGEVLCSF